MTIETINQLTKRDLGRMTLHEKVELVQRISWGIGDRVATKFKVSGAMVSMVISGKRKNALLHDYINKVSNTLIQRYIENNNLTSDDLLNIEQGIRV